MAKQEDIKLFEKQQSKKVIDLTGEYENRINTKDQATRVYSSILEEKVKEKEEWMTSVMKKAVIKHAELEVECDKASKIKADNSTVNAQGIRHEAFSEETWKKKNAPFSKLKTLADQIDAAFDNSTVEEFEKLEKLLK